jgi:hypothetical protein
LSLESTIILSGAILLHWHLFGPAPLAGLAPADPCQGPLRLPRGAPGETTKVGKGGPNPELRQKLERLSQLPKSRQRFVLEMLKTVLQQAGQ